MASLRYQVSGEREVMVIDFLTLSDFAAKIGLDIEPEQDFFEYLKKLVGSLTDAPTREALQLSGGVIRWGIVHDCHVDTYVAADQEDRVVRRVA